MGGGSGERRGDPLSELLVAWPPFRAGGLILPAGTTRPRRLVAKGAGGGKAGEALGSAAPAALRARCPNGSEVPAGRGRRRSWAGGRGTQGLTAPRPGGAVKVHGLQMLFRPLDVYRFKLKKCTRPDHAPVTCNFPFFSN